MIFFCKTLVDGHQIFQKEANGLEQLAKTSTIRIPRVVYVDDGLLILEFISPAKKRIKNFFEVFGRAYAAMHSYHSDHYGYQEDNFIGATVQKNTPMVPYLPGSGSLAWSQFYFEYRLLYQFKLLEKRGLTDGKMHQLFGKLEFAIDDLLAADEEPPSLLHGDLWGGNYIVDELGYPCLIDPAVYYGHREADLAMTTLFGGFDPIFYQAYHEALPLADGYEARQPLYQLYHLMNHLNLFGRGYYKQVMTILSSYV